MQKTLLLVLDGWGIGKENEHNAIYKAQPPFWNHLTQKYPMSSLHAREESVGLTLGCLSGSEVGHTIIGAGRIIWQQVAKIDHEINSGAFFSNPILESVKNHVTKFKSSIHFVGLLSNGGIHAHINHLTALIEWARKNSLNVKLDLFLDGRDMPPASAKSLLVPLLKNLGDVEISTVSGRDLLDRNENWTKTQKLYKHLVKVENRKNQSPLQYIDDNYSQNITDEFIPPANFSEDVISDNDAVIFFNFRADRMRQLAKIFAQKAPLEVLAQSRIPKNLFLASMSEYGDELNNVSVLYPKEIPTNSLGEWISKKGLRQFRIAEGEKYAHITYFFNGGREVVFENEERLVIPSLGLSNYAAEPAMSLPDVLKNLLNVLQKESYDFLVCNIANGDMVGHSGDLQAAIQAVTVVDDALTKIVGAAEKHCYTVIITSDHGNVESMFTETEPHTSHTFNNVPLIVTNPSITLAPSGYLHQIAPTILQLMGLEIPQEMTSYPLIQA